MYEIEVKPLNLLLVVTLWIKHNIANYTVSFLVSKFLVSIQPVTLLGDPIFLCPFLFIIYSDFGSYNVNCFWQDTE